MLFEGFHKTMFLIRSTFFSNQGKKSKLVVRRKNNYKTMEAVGRDGEEMWVSQCIHDDEICQTYVKIDERLICKAYFLLWADVEGLLV